MSIRLEEIIKHNQAVSINRNAYPGHKNPDVPNFYIATRGCDASGIDFRDWGSLEIPDDMRDANLSGADLRGVSLNWIYLEGANLDGIIIDDETFCLGSTGRDAIDTCLSMFQGGPEKTRSNRPPQPVRRPTEIMRDEIWRPS